MWGGVVTWLRGSPTNSSSNGHLIVPASCPVQPHRWGWWRDIHSWGRDTHARATKTEQNILFSLTKPQHSPRITHVFRFCLVLQTNEPRTYSHISQSSWLTEAAKGYFLAPFLISSGTFSFCCCRFYYMKWKGKEKSNLTLLAAYEEAATRTVTELA